VNNSLEIGSFVVSRKRESRAQVNGHNRLLKRLHNIHCFCNEKENEIRKEMEERGGEGGLTSLGRVVDGLTNTQRSEERKVNAMV
jgi:hypothetical protein